MKNSDLPNNKSADVLKDGLNLDKALRILQDLGPASTPKGMKERVFKAAMQQSKREEAFVDLLFMSARKMTIVSILTALILAVTVLIQPESTIAMSYDPLFALASVPEFDVDLFMITVLDGSHGGIR